MIYKLPTITFCLLISPFFINAQCISGNCMDGTGTYLYPSGAKYIGDFRNSRMNGYGMCLYSDGSIYKGEWQDGYPHGKGKKILDDGSEWKGNWVRGEAVAGNGKIIEKGQETSSENQALNNQQEGCISGNCINGWGIYVYKNYSARYEGDFQGEQAHGNGTIYYANGDKYTGDWMNGHFEGQGVLSLAGGEKISGYWKSGVHIGDFNPYQNQVYQKQQITADTPTKIWAVIVGVSTYNHMPSLRYTDDDAYRIYAFLKSPEGGALKDEHIQILIDEEATKQRILQSLNSVFANAGPKDLVLLYFSGHGLPGAFLPADYDGAGKRLYHDEIKHIFDRSAARYKLCIADACHSGGLLAAKGSTSTGNTILKYYQELARSSPGSALILSSKSTETSLESSGLRQGIFSHFLIRGLKGEADFNQDKIVSIQELFDYTYHNVRTYTGSRQSPVMKGNFDRNMPISVIR